MSRSVQRRDASWVILLVGIVLASFGFGALISGRDPLIFGVVAVAGLTLAVAMRVRRSRAGLWP